MNVILCKIENELLLTAIQYLKSIHYNVDLLVFDGFMVRKEDGKPITDESLSNISSYVKQKTGMVCSLLKNPWSTQSIYQNMAIQI